MHINQNPSQYVCVQSNSAMKMLLLGRKLLAVDEPLLAIHQSYKHLPGISALTAIPIILPNGRYSLSHRGVQAAPWQNRQCCPISWPQAPLAACCTTPPAWSHDRRVCRHTCTDKGSGGVPMCFSTQQAFLTQSSLQSICYWKCRVPLKHISKAQQWDAFKCFFFFFLFSKAFIKKYGFLWTLNSMCCFQNITWKTSWTFFAYPVLPF